MYDYGKSVYEDVRHYILTNYSDTEIREMDDSQFYDELFDQDAVTGNGPYGYANTAALAYCLKDQLPEALSYAEEFGMTTVRDLLNVDDLYQTLDCCMRISYLYQAIDQFLEEYKDGDEDSLS